MNALAVIALSKRLRTLIARGSHRSELLETCGLLDVAIESPDTKTPAPPPALTLSLPPDPPPESKSEPSQPMQSEGGAGASLPSGWSEYREAWSYGASNIKRVQILGWGAGSYFQAYDENFKQIPGQHKSLVQAMCAALGIRLHEQRPAPGTFVAVLNDSVALSGARPIEGADDCARAALERYHAQQQALKVQPGTPATAHPRPAGQARDADAHAGAARLALGSSEATGQPTQQATPCKCWQVNGKRQVNRYCSLHAAEWQTFAEQSAGELDPRERGVHPDGTSRAGCDVCEGGKR